MQLLILGGSGRTGQEVIKQALARGHAVTALVRRASSLTPTEGLTIVEGPLTTVSISAAITSSPSRPEAVISTLASVRKSDSPFAAPLSPPRMMTDATIAVLEVMEKYEIKRLIIQSSNGIGNSYDNLWCLSKIFLFKTNVRVAMNDHNDLENVVRKSNIEWTLVRPVMLNEKDGIQQIKVFGERGEGAGMMPSISRQSVADFIVEECVEKADWIKKTPVISN